MLNRLFRPGPLREAGRALYPRLVEQARTPGLYGELGVPDTAEGRFEAYTLHLVLLLDRLRAAGEPGREVSQALFDTFVKSLDHALREMGVGDLSVGRKMRRLGEALYGRAKNYYAAFDALPETQPLCDLLARTVYAGVDAPPVEGLAAYVVHERDHLATQPEDAVLDGQVAWSPR